MLGRGSGTSALADAGSLGGSQAGARVAYRLNGNASAPIALAARLSSPLRRRGVEAAIGVEAQPVAALPIRFVAERRFRVSGEGRSAFALFAHGGVYNRQISGDFRLDAYAQAGLVGARRRDAFVDAAATLVRPLGSELAVGAGVWAAAQPGLSRLDVGPRLTRVFAVGDASARVSLDYRFRVGGAAAPGSGLTLTIGSSF